MDQTGGERGQFTDAEVESLVQRLDEWGQQLPENEQRLLLLVLARVEGAQEIKAEYISPGVTIEQAATAALRPFIGTDVDVSNREADGGWVRGGEPWLRSVD